MNSNPAFFEQHKVRRVYHEATETWFFSIIDIVQILTQQPSHQAARNYWKVLKNRLNKEGSEPVTNCNRLKMVAEDGKLRLTDVATAAHYFWRNGMNSLAIKLDDRAIDVSFTQTSLHFVLADGREISVPLEWFPKLRDANKKERDNWRFIGNGIGVHWSSIDEDIAVRTLMQGND